MTGDWCQEATTASQPVAGADSEGETRRLRRQVERLQELVVTQSMLVEADFDLNAFMQTIVDRLQRITNATDVAVELVDGDEMVYRAVTAGFQQHIGLRLPRIGSLSGLCVETRETLLCSDAEADPRVNRAAFQRVGRIRSMVCAPLFEGREAVGVLKIMACEPAAFSDEDVETLRSMATTLGAALGKQLAFRTSQLLLQQRTQALQALEIEIDQRIKLETHLRASEARVRNVIAGAHQAIVTIDETGQVTGWSRHAELIFGWAATEALGQSLADLIIPVRYRVAHRHGMTRFLSTGVATMINRRIEISALRKSGEEFPAELAVSAIKGPEGWEFTALMHDITYRKAQNELFKNAFHHAAIGVALVGLDTRFLEVNGAFCDILGYSEKELLDLDVQAITHPDDLEEDLALAQRLMAGEIPSYQITKRCIHKDGRPVWIRLSGSLMRGEDGRPQHFIAQIDDISARIEAEARYRLLADNVSDSIGLHERDGRYLYMSPSCERVLGYSPEELVGTMPFQHVPDEDLPAVQEAHARLLAAPVGTAVEHLFRMRRKDGRLVWIELMGRLALNEQGKVCMVTAARDITSRVEAQEEVQRREIALAAMAEQLSSARDTAEAASRAKSEFLASMSHELRTPLNAVIGFADLLLAADPPAEERNRYLSLMREAGRTLLTLINAVLDLSKIEAGRLELELLDVDLSGLVRICAELVRPMAEEKGLKLRVELSPALPLWVKADPTRLRQVLLNLLNNAIKFTESGRVTLTARMMPQPGAEPLTRLSVEDTGIGISPAHMAGIFMPFDQGDASTARRFGGTGLGLAVSRQLCELMGGDLQAESTPGQGSLFWVDLPLSTAVRAAEERGAERATTLAPNTRILVAEDLLTNQLLVRAVLERAGAIVTIAADGQQAIEAVRHAAETGNPFHLVLMDVQMPGMDGLEATGAIRSLEGRAGTVPIVALSAGVLTEEVAHYRAAGMDDHVPKPIDAQTLLSAVARWVDAVDGAEQSRCGQLLLPAEEQTSADPVAASHARDRSAGT